MKRFRNEMLDVGKFKRGGVVATVTATEKKTLPPVRAQVRLDSERLS